MDAQTLTAFYDLSVCPITYDFTVFSALAEMARLRHGCGTLRIVIVPGNRDGFRNDDASYSTAHKQWRLRNIVIPSCWLFNQSTSVTVCSGRAEAVAIEAALAGPVFPLAYTTGQPVGDFLWSGVSAALACGETVPSARPSDEASRIARDWLATRAGDRRPVTITLRESSHAPVRNSNKEAWHRFACSLDSKVYLPVIIPDSEHAFDLAPEEPDDPVLWTAPALSLDLRLALYEQAWLNLMVPNGPGVLCWLSNKARFIMFRMRNEEWDNTTGFYQTSLGLPLGGQLPNATSFQRLVWEPDHLDVIQREFAAMATRIGDARPAEAAAPDPANAEDPMAVAVRLHATGRHEEAVAIYQDIVAKFPRNADAWHMLGLIAHQAELPDAAERMIRHAISLRPSQANYSINLASVLRKSGRQDEAAHCLRRAIDLAPEDAGAYADLADLMHAQGANEKAKEALLKAINLRPDSQDLCERAARILQALGHTEAAANLFGRAIDLREAARKRALQARSSMSEIPVATLKFH